MLTRATAVSRILCQCAFSLRLHAIITPLTCCKGFAIACTHIMTVRLEFDSTGETGLCYPAFVPQRPILRSIFKPVVLVYTHVSGT